MIDATKVDSDNHEEEEEDEEDNHSTSNQSPFNPQPSLGMTNKRKLSQPTTEFATVQPKLGEPSALMRNSLSQRNKEETHPINKITADFFYENGIPLDAVNSRSFDLFWPSSLGLKPITYDDLCGPLLKGALKEIDETKNRHVETWRECGCTLVVDGWTTEGNQHLINFLVNSRDGTFFLESVDASSHSHDATLLADLLQTKIEKIGKEYVVQVVTKNVGNYKAAGRLLEERIPTLFWTPCAAHCLYLMLEDIGKLPDFAEKIESGRYVTNFIYRHERVLNEMRNKIGGKDLIKPGVTRFATTFLTLQSMYKHKNSLRSLFVSGDWCASKLSSTKACKRVSGIVLSSRFWDGVEDLIRVSTPLLNLLRLVAGYEEEYPMPELVMAMNVAKKKIQKSFANKPKLLAKLMEIMELRWTDQMEVILYGAALFLQPAKYFELKTSDYAYARKLRAMFNRVLEKMITDVDLQTKIMDEVGDYDNMRGRFGWQLVIEENPVVWWHAFGSHNRELHSLACRILRLCCSSFGCGHNWNTFEFIHLKKRNTLEQKRLNDLAYIQYNRKILSKEPEGGSSFNPLIVEEFQWDNEWVDNACKVVYPDEGINASTNLKGCSYSRKGACNSNSASVLIEDVGNVEFELFPNDDKDVEDADDAMVLSNDTTDRELELFDT